MAQKAMMIVNAVVNLQEKEALVYYQKNAGLLFRRAGGKLVDSFEIEERIIGNKGLQIVVMMEFESSEIIKEVIESEAYKSLLNHREKAFEELDVYIAKSSN